MCYTVCPDLHVTVKRSRRREQKLSKQVQVIKLAQEWRSARQIVMDFEVGKTHIQKVIKRKAKVMDAFSSGAP